MNVIITGASGFVGGEVVRQAIGNDRIGRALVLTRKPLAEEFKNSPKVTIIEHKDFSTYPPELLQQLSGAQGCIWAIGGRATQFPNVATARKVSVDFTLAAAKAFLAELAPQLPDGKPFRFVFCSGKFAEWDQEKHLRVLSDTRHIKGEVEKGLCELADANQSKLDVHIVRPGGIMAKGANRLKKTSANMVGFIGVDHLARDMIQIAIDGHSQRIVDAEVLMKM